MREMLFSILFFLALFCPGCGSPPPGRGEGEIGAARVENGQTVQFRVETVAANLEVPWAIAFAPDERVFVTERPGRVRVIEQGRLRPEPVATIREVESAEESGLIVPIAVWVLRQACLDAPDLPGSIKKPSRPRKAA